MWKSLKGNPRQPCSNYADVARKLRHPSQTFRMSQKRSKSVWKQQHPLIYEHTEVFYRAIATCFCDDALSLHSVQRTLVAPQRTRLPNATVWLPTSAANPFGGF